MRIRYCGVLANRNRQRNIALCRKLIADAGIGLFPVHAYETLESELEPVAEPFDAERCRVCPTGIMRLVRSYARPLLAPEIVAEPALAWDSS